jgi:hypothetical protein
MFDVALRTPLLKKRREMRIPGIAATCSDEGGRGFVAGMTSGGQIFIVASRLARCVVIFRMLSPLSARR